MASVLRVGRRSRQSVLSHAISHCELDPPFYESRLLGKGRSQRTVLAQSSIRARSGTPAQVGSSGGNDCPIYIRADAQGGIERVIARAAVRELLSSKVLRFVYSMSSPLMPPGSPAALGGTASASSGWPRRPKPHTSVCRAATVDSTACANARHSGPDAEPPRRA